MASDSSYSTTRPFSELFAVPLRNGLTRPKAVRGAGVKMVNMGEVFAYSRINDVDMERVELSDVERGNYLLEPDDLLFARQSLVWDGAGKCTLFLGGEEDVTFESHIIRARLDGSIACPRFYFYYFGSPQGRALMETIIEQVAAAGIRGSDLAELGVPYPDVDAQRAVAAGLTLLDDKIELNRRMNETLEAMARAIFKSWFVDFDPVVAKADGRKPYGMDDATAALFPDSFEDSDLGPIPAGWKAGRLGDHIGINERSAGRGYPHSVVSYVDISSVAEGRLNGTTEHLVHRAPSRAKRLVRHGDTIWSCVRPNRKSYYYIHYPAENLIVSTGFAVLTPRSIPASFLYQFATTEDFVEYLTRLALGHEVESFPREVADQVEEPLREFVERRDQVRRVRMGEAGRGSDVVPARASVARGLV